MARMYLYRAVKRFQDHQTDNSVIVSIDLNQTLHVYLHIFKRICTKQQDLILGNWNPFDMGTESKGS